MTEFGRQVLRFQTTAKASADAHALVNPRWAKLDILADGIAFVSGLVLLAAGQPFGMQPFGIVLIGSAALALASTRFHPLQRWLISWRFRSLLGKTTEVTIDDRGLDFANPLATTFVPWSSITVVRSNDQTVAFIRDRVLVGYIPSSAFASPRAQAEVVEFATRRVAAAAPARD